MKFLILYIKTVKVFFGRSQILTWFIEIFWSIFLILTEIFLFSVNVNKITSLKTITINMHSMRLVKLHSSRQDQPQYNDLMNYIIYYCRGELAWLSVAWLSVAFVAKFIVEKWMGFYSHALYVITKSCEAIPSKLTPFPRKQQKEKGKHLFLMVKNYKHPLHVLEKSNYPIRRRSGKNLPPK